MTGKKVLTISLLGFVAISLLVAVADVAGWRGNPRGRVSEVIDPEAAGVTAVERRGKDAGPRLAAIYFHATHRCPTCKKIEAYAHEALQPEIDHGKLAWEVADYTAPENAALVDQLQVMTSTVVMVEKQGNQIVRWKNLEEVWEHTDDQTKFANFIQKAWRSFQENL